MGDRTDREDVGGVGVGRGRGDGKNEGGARDAF